MTRKWLIAFIIFLSGIFSSCTLHTTSTTTSSVETEISTSSPREEYLQLHLSAWGLGSTILFYHTNERDHDWYINQFDTGIHYHTNCGPTSVQMAGLWQSAEFDHTAEEARTLFSPTGGWWYDADISGALTHFGITHEALAIGEIDDLKAAIEMGFLVLVNNNMSRIPYNSNLESRVNRFYQGVSGHYLLVKGVLETDTGTYYEVYDPYNGSHYYHDESPRGQNRFYESGVLETSIISWYPKVYLISP